MATGVRLARTSDLEDVSRVQVEAWRTSYSEILPTEVLSALDPGDMAMDWARALLQPGSHRLLVALGDGGIGSGTVVGALAFGPATTGAAGAGSIELLVVAPAARGQGHGSRLVHAAVDHLVAAGCTEAICWIPLADEPLRAFLQSMGWGPDGAYRDLEVAPERLMRQVRMVTRLVDEAAESVPAAD